MGGYIGSSVGNVANAAERKQTYSITTATTSLTGLAYTPTKVHVFHNGVRLVDSTDYTATNGTSITLTNAAQNGDEVVVISYPSFQTSDTVSAANGGTFAGNIAMSGTLAVTGVTTLSNDIDLNGNDLILDADGDSKIEASVDDVITVTSGGSERARFDTSGNLLIGHTSQDTPVDNGGAGVTLRPAGIMLIGGTGTSIYANREDSDGEIMQFRKDGTTVGSIGTEATALAIGHQDTGIKFAHSLDAVLPFNLSTYANRDNAIDIGYGSVRFDDIYATNGTIQTSDENEKQDIEALSDAEKRVATAAKGLIKKFRWKDKVAEKGNDARIHVGIIAQDLKAAFEAEGLDAGKYAMFISSTWTDEETGEEKTRLGVRYSELLAFIIGAL
jgi:hypothetical protein